MDLLSVTAIAVALAMDAFAVAIVAGLTVRPLTGRHVFRLAFHFGLFQFLMPLIGWAAGAAVQRHLADYDHWIALGLLSFIGGKMIWGSIRGKEHEQNAANDPTSGWQLVVLSIATSIDALAVGLSLGLIGSAIFRTALIIGFVAAFFTALGMVLGRKIGSIWGKRVEIAGGIILIAIGVKIAIDHLLG
ncbi:MAG: manganese efflux pump [Acidobacteria bacterium]|nr:manganese efflux pump [Acidobacteriota bacterium]